MQPTDRDIEEAEQADIRRKETADDEANAAIAEWLATDLDAALEACDEAMYEPAAMPTSAREIVENGYRHAMKTKAA